VSNNRLKRQNNRLFFHFFRKQYFSKRFWFKSVLDSNKEWITHLIYPKPTHTSNNSAFYQTSWILRHQSTRSSLFNKLPLFDEDKSLVACIVLFESDPAPAKQILCKYRAYITAGYEDTQTSFMHNHLSRKTSPKTSVCSSRFNMLNSII